MRKVLLFLLFVVGLSAVGHAASCGTTGIYPATVAADQAACGNVAPFPAAPATFTSLSACGTLSANTNYQLSTNLGSSATATCLTIPGPNTVVDLNGHTITGYVNGTDPNGIHVYSSAASGAVTCSADSSPQVSCVYWQVSTSALNSIFELDHITITNTATSTNSARNFFMDYNTVSSGSLIGSITTKVHNITSTSAAGTSSLRIVNLQTQGLDQYTEFYNNNTTCVTNAGACQGIVAYGGWHYLIHNNIATDQLSNPSDTDTARAFICDTAPGGCEIYNNFVTTNDSRCVRYRTTGNGQGPNSFHDNICDAIVSGTNPNYIAAMHLADPTPDVLETENFTAYHNIFNITSGTVMMVRDGTAILFEDNKVNTTGSCSSCVLMYDRFGSYATQAQSIRTTINGTWSNSPQSVGDSGVATSPVNLCQSGTGNANLSVNNSVCPMSTHFVRGTASGANNGTSWTDAWTSLSSVSGLSPGDTVCIAGGSYGALTFPTAGVSGSPITYKRAITSDTTCGSSSFGWASSYDSQVSLSSITLSKDYVNVNGMVSNGITMAVPNTIGTPSGISVSGPVTSDNLYNIEASGCSSSGCNQNGNSIAANLSHYNGSSYDAVTNLTIHGVNFHGQCTNIVFNNAPGLIIENSRLADSIDNTAGHPFCSPAVIQEDGGANVTIRYNEITNWQAEGIVTCLSASCTTNAAIYGNILHDPFTGGTAKIIEAQHNSNGPYLLYNNTIVNNPNVCSSTASGGSFAGGTQGRNNIFWGNAFANCGLPSEDYDYSDLSLSGETHGQGSASNPFTNISVNDYTLAFNTNPGLNLGSPYNVDFSGNTRTTWSRGAYEYITPTQVAAPTFTPPAGTYSGAQSVAINSATPGASLFYTKDGTTPVPIPALDISLFNIEAAGLATPNPYPYIVRTCCGSTPAHQGVTWNQVEQSRGTFDFGLASGTGSGGIDKWVATAKSHNSVVLYTLLHPPTWATGGTIQNPPLQIYGPGGTKTSPVPVACQNVLASVSPTTDCIVKEFWTAFMRHFCHVTSQPVSPIIGGCDIKYLEMWNEFGGDNYWTGTYEQLAQISFDATVIIKAYCGDCVVLAGSVSAGGDGFHGTSGQSGNYSTAMLLYLQEWGRLGPPYPDAISFHPYPSRTDVIPVPFPTTLVQHSFVSCSSNPGDASCKCTSGTPNVECRTAIKDQVNLLKSTTVLNNSSISSWAGSLPVWGTEGSQGETKGLTDGVSGSSTNTWFLRKAYISQWMITLQIQGIVSAQYYNWQDQCWMPIMGTNTADSDCSSDPLIPSGLTPIQPAFVQTQAWLHNTTFTGSLTSTAVTGGNIWKVNVLHNGIVGQLVWFDGWLGSTTYTVPGGTLYSQTLDGTISLVSSGTVTLNQQPQLLFNGLTSVYSGAISVPASITIKAIGTKPLLSNSTVASASFIIASGTAATPTFSPSAGSYSTPQTVTISTSTGGATICYTTSGATPAATTPGTCSTGTTYSGPITVSSSQTVKALATEVGFTNSSVASAAYTITLVVANPTFSPVAGTYTTPQSVAISVGTAGATVCYTTDGTTPTATSPGTCSHGTVYTSPVSVSTTQTIQALGTKSGLTNSTVSSALYTITPVVVNAPTFSPAAGNYTSTQNVSLSSTTSGATICYTLDGSTPAAATAGTCSAGTTYSVPIVVSTPLTIKALGTKSGDTNSSVASAVYSFTVSAPTFSPVAGTYATTQSVSLSSSTVGSTICYTTDGSIPAASSPGTCSAGTTYSGAISVSSTQTVKALATQSGYTNSSVSSALYTITPLTPAATPTFSPVAGTYNNSQSVAISSTTSGATLCYTTDGSTPTSSSPGVCGTGTTYTTTVSVTSSQTIKAIATKSGNADSSVGTAAYSLVVDVPSISPTGGTYGTAQSVSISDPTTGATLCYTTDGTTPTAVTSGTCSHGSTYSGPLTVSTNQTIIALGTKTGYTNSTTSSQTYSIVLDTPTFSPVAGTYASVQSVVISTTTSGGVICFTTDGSTPAAVTPGTCSTGSPYTSAISVSVSQTIKALVTKAGNTNGSVASAAYVINLPVPAATPTFSPVTGTYSSTQTVTISDTTPSSVIHYTLDGSTPTSGSPTYSSPLSVSVSTQIKAIAIASGYLNSSVGSAVYIISTGPNVGKIGGNGKIGGSGSIGVHP